MSFPSATSTDKKVKVFQDGVAAGTTGKYLNFVGDMVTVTENPALKAYDVELSTDADQKVAVYSNAVQVGTVGRKLNLTTDFSVTEDAGNDRFNIALANAGYTVLPDGTTTVKTKIGTFYGGSNGGNGLLSGIVMNGTMTTELGASDMLSVYTTGGSDADLGGFSTPNFITRRAYNPTFKCRFKNNVSTEKMFAGFLSSVAHPINDPTPLDGVSGAAFGFDDGDTKFVAWHNNNAGTAQKTLTATNKDTAVHDLTITLTDSPGSVTIIFDGVTVVNASTTAPPASTTNLALHNNAEAVGSTLTPYAIAYAYLIQDK